VWKGKHASLLSDYILLEELLNSVKYTKYLDKEGLMIALALVMSSSLLLRCRYRLCVEIKMKTSTIISHGIIIRNRQTCVQRCCAGSLDTAEEYGFG
jgi:hypothetical protein